IRARRVGETIAAISSSITRRQGRAISPIRAWSAASSFVSSRNAGNRRRQTRGGRAPKQNASGRRVKIRSSHRDMGGPPSTYAPAADAAPPSPGQMQRQQGEAQRQEQKRQQHVAQRPGPGAGADHVAAEILPVGDG